MYGNTLLHHAAQNGHLSIVQYLIKQGSRINAENCDFETFLVSKPLFIYLFSFVIKAFLSTW